MEDIKVPFHEKRTTTISFLFSFKGEVMHFGLEMVDKKKIKKTTPKKKSSEFYFKCCVCVLMPRSHCPL